MTTPKKQLQNIVDGREVIAIYLPQFHQHPKNNEVWGAGFTDWTTTLNAYPLFKKHKQPMEISSFGKYDLKSTPSIISRQYDNATEMGITGFGFYHYRFSNTERALDFPIKYLRQSDMPVRYMINWVNTNWTKSWIGDDTTILHQQTYDFSDIPKFARELADYFGDIRYIRYQGKPLFYIHKPKDAPDEYLETLLDEIEAISDRPFVIAPECHVNSKSIHLCDRVMSYPPGDLPVNTSYTIAIKNMFRAIATRLNPPEILQKLIFSSVNVHEASLFLNLYSSYLNDKIRTDREFIPTFLSGWDNTPRYKHKGTVLHNYHFLDFKHAVEQVLIEHPQTDLLFFKSWNEWAEGNVLENV